MASLRQQKLLGEFRGAYGRMMANACMARLNGFDNHDVAKAIKGEGPPQLEVIHALRDKAHEILHRCNRAGVPAQDCIDAAAEARQAVEEEFAVTIQGVS